MDGCCGQEGGNNLQFPHEINNFPNHVLNLLANHTSRPLVLPGADFYPLWPSISAVEWPFSHTWLTHGSTVQPRLWTSGNRCHFGFSVFQWCLGHYSCTPHTNLAPLKLRNPGNRDLWFPLDSLLTIRSYNAMDSSLHTDSSHRINVCTVRKCILLESLDDTCCSLVEARISTWTLALPCTLRSVSNCKRKKNQLYR